MGQITLYFGASITMTERQLQVIPNNLVMADAVSFDLKWRNCRQSDH